MSERSMVTVLKTVVRKHRGFESLSLRQRPPGGASKFRYPEAHGYPGVDLNKEKQFGEVPKRPKGLPC